MKLKGGVKLDGLVPQMVLVAYIVEDIYRQFAHLPYHVTITSAKDGIHSVGSFHSKDGLCRALDFRTKDLVTSIDKHKLCATIKEALGADFDVIFEYEGLANEHIHVEYDPK